MQALKLPPARGWIWVKEGFALYRRNPFALAANLMLMMLLIMLMLAGATALVGGDEKSPETMEKVALLAQCALSLLAPPLLVGLYEVCHRIHEGQMVMPAAVLGGFSRNIGRLMQLSGLMLAYSLAVFALEQLTQSPVVSVVLSMPLLMANWFSPLLTGRLGTPPLKSAFFSMIAVYRNLGAVAVFCLSSLVVFVLLPSLAAGLLTAIAPAFGAAIISVLALALLPALFSAFYASTRDIFPALWDAPAD
ncbi:hypothetical protein GCM10025771_01190 [Niveibacterium umoris]|uniref:Glycerophosphoryl diester phosphodiesterase membrane domain-containing protein n=1 Tax=Niveibacterium umoris TaxID=1193620 RepID=A0A840BS44_9RHOO|nr:hypothetical protein [Niveibacterium umoris]MBB4014338.1 hypothetical protein [Niveibacterium umoris]